MKSTIVIVGLGIAVIALTDPFTFDSQLSRIRRSVLAAHTRVMREVNANATDSSSDVAVGQSPELTDMPKPEMGVDYSEYPEREHAEPELYDAYGAPEPEPQGGDYGNYNDVYGSSNLDADYEENEYYEYGGQEGDSTTVDPFEDAMMQSFAQHLMAYPNGDEHLQCIAECKPQLAEIDQFDSGEMDDEDPYQVLFGANSNNTGAPDFLINISGDLPRFWDLLGNGTTPFDVARFERMCSAYQSGVDCANACPYGFFTRLINGAYRPIEYMCTVAKQDYIKYATCAQSADTSGCATECEEPYANATQANTLKTGARVLSNMCEYMSCQADCAAPKIVEACNNDENAAEVYKQTMSQLVAATVDITQQMGFVPGPIGQCVEVVANATQLPSAEKLQPPLEIYIIPVGGPDRGRGGRPHGRHGWSSRHGHGHHGRRGGWGGGGARGGEQSALQMQLDAMSLQLITMQVVKTQKEILNLDLQNQHLALRLRQLVNCPQKLACDAGAGPDDAEGSGEDEYIDTRFTR